MVKQMDCNGALEIRKRTAIESNAGIVVCRQYDQQICKFLLIGEPYYSDDYFGDTLPNWIVPASKDAECFGNIDSVRSWGTKEGIDVKRDVDALEQESKFLGWLGHKLWFPVVVEQEVEILFVAFRGKDDAPFKRVDLGFACLESQAESSKVIVASKPSKKSNSLTRSAHQYFIACADYLRAVDTRKTTSEEFWRNLCCHWNELSVNYVSSGGAGRVRLTKDGEVETTQDNREEVLTCLAFADSRGEVWLSIPANGSVNSSLVLLTSLAKAIGWIFLENRFFKARVELGY